MGTAYSALKQVAVGFTKRPEYVAFVAQCFSPYNKKWMIIIMPVRFEVAAYPASIPAKEPIYFYCAPFPFSCTHGQCITRQQ
jgi:hypothetical protein